MYIEPNYVLPDGTELYEQELTMCAKFHNKSISTLTEADMVEWIDTVRCHPYLEPITTEDITPMSYEEWFLANEDQLYAHYMQSGAYTERDFDIVKAIHNDYQTYLNKGSTDV